MTVKQDFYRSYRAARLLFNGHKIAAHQELKRLDGIPEAVISAALRLRCTHEWRTGTECTNSINKTGRSRKTCLRLSLRSARYRHATGWRLGKYATSPHVA